MIRIRVDSRDLDRTLAELRQSVGRPRAVMQAAARSLRRLLVSHFTKLNRSPNKLGGKRTHWWAAVARSTQVASVTDHQAVVSISEPGVALHYFGGVVRPKQARALTIPIDPEAHGRRAGTISHATGAKLFLVKLRGGAFLARKESGGDGAKDSLRLLYVLKKSVTMKPNAGVLPPAPVMTEEILRSARAMVQSLINRAARSGPTGAPSAG